MLRFFNSRCFPKVANARNFAIDGYGRVKTGLATEKLVKNMKVGDEVLTPHGSAKITHVNKKYTFTGYYELVELNKMLITPEHPIYIYDSWELPKEIKKIEFVKCTELYSFELDKYHVMTVNGNNIMASDK